LGRILGSCRQAGTLQGRRRSAPVRAADPQARAVGAWRDRERARTALAAEPLRRYLLDSVAAAVTCGLAQCVVERPDDPLQVGQVEGWLPFLRAAAAVDHCAAASQATLKHSIGGPSRHQVLIAHLRAAADAFDRAYEDPYADPIYEAREAKAEAKRGRDAARAEAARLKGERCAGRGAVRACPLPAGCQGCCIN
jgi:hypothetical protein